MRRVFILLTICFFVFSCKPKHELVEVYRTDQLSILKLSEHAYIHISYLETNQFGTVSCNGAIFTGHKEAVVIDTPTTNEASRELIDWINRSLDAQVVAVVPTHYHEDNLGGLDEFHRAKIPSYALAKTIRIAGINNDPLPRHPFDGSVELQAGNRNIRIEFFGEGHTCDNVAVWFPSEKILFGGCLVKAVGADKGNLEEANTEAWPETVRRLKAAWPKAEIVIPGHGEPGGIELLDYTINLFE